MPASTRSAGGSGGGGAVIVAATPLAAAAAADSLRTPPPAAAKASACTVGGAASSSAAAAAATDAAASSSSSAPSSSGSAAAASAGPTPLQQKVKKQALVTPAAASSAATTAAATSSARPQAPSDNGGSAAKGGGADVTAAASDGRMQQLANAAAGGDGTKHVHFGAAGGSGGNSQMAAAAAASPPAEQQQQGGTPSSAGGKRGLVSRRGRYVSPGRRASPPLMMRSAASASPPAQDNPSSVAAAAAAAAASITAAAASFRGPSAGAKSCGAGDYPTATKTENPGIPVRAISTDAATAETSTSSSTPKAGTDKATGTAATSSPASSGLAETKNSVSFSPRPSPDRYQAAGRSHSPMVGSIPFHQATPTRKASDKENDLISAAAAAAAAAVGDRKLSPRRDREQCVTTPTNFAVDYGKNQAVPSSFDNSNVLAWLHSPTANGLFSPGGYGSIMNTPHGPLGGGGGPANVPWSPRTPTVTTSFFFSDAANLPRGDHLTPGGGGQGAGSGTKSGKSDGSAKKNGLSNIICISPLASNNGVRCGGTGISTPMNLRDVFSSPRERGFRDMPGWSDTPTRPSPTPPRVPPANSRGGGGSKDPSLDAHLAEREVMEDEDLTVLLQLASNATPRAGSAAAGGPVFRGGSGKKDGASAAAASASATSSGEEVPGLHLPKIGGKAEGAKPEPPKARETKPENGGEFVPPQLGMRSSSFSGGAKKSGPKEVYVGGKRKDELAPSGKKAKNAATGSTKAKDADRTTSSTANSTKAPLSTSASNPYSLPLHLPGHERTSYYGMTSSLPPGTGGSLRIVVGGPPPPSRNGKSAVSTTTGLRMGGDVGGPPPPMYHDYPPGAMPYPPHGMYSQYGGPPPSHLGYPYQSPYPPAPSRHQMPMYGAQHPPQKPPAKAGASPKKAGSKAGPNKRSLPTASSKTGTPSPKKPRKTSPGGQAKKKNRSPQITDKAERQKAAQQIQALNQASGGKNDKSAALAAAILRGVTMRPSGKWQAQLYFAGKSRYIGVFDTREKAALAYEIAREKLKKGPKDHLDPKATENLVNQARKAAFEGVNEKLTMKK